MESFYMTKGGKGEGGELHFKSVHIGDKGDYNNLWPSTQMSL